MQQQVVNQLNDISINPISRFIRLMYSVILSCHRLHWFIFLSFSLDWFIPTTFHRDDSQYQMASLVIIAVLIVISDCSRKTRNTFTIYLTAPFPSCLLLFCFLHGCTCTTVLTTHHSGQGATTLEWINEWNSVSNGRAVTQGPRQRRKHLTVVHCSVCTSVPTTRCDNNTRTTRNDRITKYLNFFSRLFLFLFTRVTFR